MNRIAVCAIVFGVIPTVLLAPVGDDTLLSEPCVNGADCDSSRIYIPITQPGVHYTLTPTQYAILITVCFVLLAVGLSMKYLCWRKALETRLKNQQIAVQRLAQNNSNRGGSRQGNAGPALNNSSNWRAQDQSRIQVDSMIDRVNHQGGLPAYASVARPESNDQPPDYNEALRSNSRLK